MNHPLTRTIAARRWWPTDDPRRRGSLFDLEPAGYGILRGSNSSRAGDLSLIHISEPTRLALI
eukprot:7748202-Alexandrium_andersonii.AAC.1